MHDIVESVKLDRSRHRLFQRSSLIVRIVIRGKYKQFDGVVSMKRKLTVVKLKQYISNLNDVKIDIEKELYIRYEIRIIIRIDDLSC